MMSRLISVPVIEAVYIDTLGTYDPSHLQSLMRTDDISVLERIHIITAFDMVNLFEACETVKQYLNQLVPIEILIIDTIANPMSALMNKGQPQGITAIILSDLGYALMQSFTNFLRMMTTQYNLATILVNTAVKTNSNAQSAFTATQIKPALGVSWSFSADTCVLLHKSVDEETVIAEVVRSRSGVQ